jgi:D-glycero-alpha-D-manno-heptose 1-phosphate guanylyltransferase
LAKKINTGSNSPNTSSPFRGWRGLEAIILAGGLGTRLKSVVSDVPKCMAPVNGIPFISYIITYLQKQGINKFIFSVGYKSEAIIEYVETHFKNLNKIFIIEEEQLGTGGAIKKSCKEVMSKNVIVVNGDTIFNINLADLMESHHLLNAACTLALKELNNFDRYGAVEFDDNDTITAFHEKKFCTTGFINGGIYALNVSAFLEKELPEKFSFEKEYLEKYLHEKKISGIAFNNYFIDIGVPEDYEKFKQEYASAAEVIKKDSSADNFELMIESIGAFLELLD